MKRVTSGVITSGVGLIAIVAGLAIIDGRVRSEFTSLATGHAEAGALAGVGVRVQEMGLLVVQAVRDQSIEHAPLTLFALVALMLFVLMLRT